MTLINFMKTDASLVDTLTRALSDFCGFKLPDPVQADDWVIFNHAQLESEDGFYAHKYEGVHCLPFRFAINGTKLASQVAIDQAAALDDHLLVSSYELVSNWIRDALVNLEWAAYCAIDDEKVDPTEVGFDLILDGPKELKIRRWYRDEQDTFNGLLPDAAA
ncbi:MAG: hypothetical protein Q4A82_02980 [Corynebacterium sp.]|nr:hypothetical protein [Corynebacterium sp.]